MTGSHLAYWERTRGAILEHLRADPRVCVLYANFNAQRAGKLEFRLPALLRHGGAARERPGEGKDFQPDFTARADSRRRRHRDRRPHQDQQGRGYSRQIYFVIADFCWSRLPDAERQRDTGQAEREHGPDRVSGEVCRRKR